MNTKSFSSNFLLFSALFFCLFSTVIDAQTIRTEKKASVAAYIRDKDEESGLVRKRTVEINNQRTVSAVKPTALQVADLEKITFALINQKRAEMGLDPLAWSEEVAKIARLHSENMVKYNFFSHRGIDGKSVDGRADSMGLSRWTSMGENIAYNRGFGDPCETAVEKWLLSPGHRNNLLNTRWQESAVGVAVTADGTYFFTQVFLKRR